MRCGNDASREGIDALRQPFFPLSAEADSPQNGFSVVKYPRVKPKPAAPPQEDLPQPAAFYKRITQAVRTLRHIQAQKTMQQKGEQ
jgi:hypothetical protein